VYFYFVIFGLGVFSSSIKSLVDKYIPSISSKLAKIFFMFFENLVISTLSRGKAISNKLFFHFPETHLREAGTSLQAWINK
jgi:hypothetical protein